MKKRVLLSGLFGIALMSASMVYAADAPAEKPAGADREAADPKAGAKMPTAMVTIMGAGAMKDKVSGMLTLTETKEGVQVKGEITGLTPGKHGFHIHEKGDLSDPKLTSAGGHFNPGGHKHGGPESDMRHAGDFGNITANADGVAKIDSTFKGVTLEGPADGIMGRSFIVHAGEDDMKTDPSGNSGDRIAGGVVEKKEMKAGKGEKKKGKKKKAE